MVSDLYNFFYERFFGSGWIGSMEYADLACTLLATIGGVFMVAIPFLVVWRVITMIVKGW